MHSNAYINATNQPERGRGGEIELAPCLSARRKNKSGSRFSPSSGLIRALAIVAAAFYLNTVDYPVCAFSLSRHRSASSGLFRVRPHPVVDFPSRFTSALSSSDFSSESKDDSRGSSDDPTIANNDEITKDEADVGSAGESAEVSDDNAEENTDSALSKLRKRLFGGDRMKFDKATMAKLGVSMVLSYGFVSNVSGCICVSICWFLFSKQTGLSPLSPGQWPKFLAFYAGFFAFLNVIRPARFALSVALNRYFDRLISFFQRRFDCGRGGATFLVGFIVNFCGSWAVIAAGVSIASALSGVPVWAGR